MDENTEKLINSNEKDKDKKTKKKLIFSIIGVVILIAALGVLYYFYSSKKAEETYQKNLDLGQQYLQDKDYEQAVIAYKEAVTVTKKTEKLIPAYDGLAIAATFAAEPEEAKTAYENLFSLTGEESYQYQAEQAGSGNSGANIINHANVVQHANDTFYVEQNNNNFNFYSIDEDKKVTKLSSLPVVQSTGNGTPISDLNAWGDKLYFIYNGDIYKLDINTGDTESVLSKDSAKSFVDGKLPSLAGIPEGAGIAYLQIYNGSLYFMVNYGQLGNILVKSDLSGENPSLVLGDTTEKAALIKTFFIKDDVIYGVHYDKFGSDSKIYSIDLNDPSKTDELFAAGEEETILSMALVNDQLIYNIQHVPSDFSQEMSLRNDIYYTDLETKESGVLSSPGSVSTVNADSSHLYYVSDNEVYVSDINGDSPVKIGEQPKVETSNNGYLKAVICLTASSGYVTSSTSRNALETLGSYATTYVFSLDDPEDYESIKEVLNDSSEETVSDKTETDQKETETDDSADKIVSDGVYSYSEGENLTELMIGPTGNSTYYSSTPAFLGFWYNNGASASVEDFNIPEIPASGGTFTLEGTRSREMYNISIYPSGNGVDITITPVNGGKNYMAQLFGQSGDVFSAHYTLQ